MLLMYIDSHCHLEDKRFDADRAEVFARAKAGRRRAPCSPSAMATDPAPARSTAPSSSPSNTTGSTRRSAFILTKPRWPSKQTSTNWSDLARSPKVIAWGEIGLDYFYDHSPRDVQQRVFLQQMEMARAAKLPIIIHCRPSDNSENAWDDLLRLIREHWASSGLGGVLHCFTGTVDHARAALDLGFMISFAGNITYPKAQNIRDAASHGSARPHVHRDRLALSCAGAASRQAQRAGLRGRSRPPDRPSCADLSGEEIGLQTTQNFYNFFGLTKT